MNGVQFPIYCKKTITDVPVSVTMDLVGVEADRIEVLLDPGSLTGPQMRFFIPKTVPGTYSEDNYGRFVEDLQALDYEGKPLQVKRDDENTWTIYGAQQMDKIRYFVNDTFDTENEIGEAVFSPAGSNILKNKNYLLNLHGFVGYFEGLKELPYRLEFKVPEGMRPVTSLREFPLENGNFGFRADRYFDVIDNPVQFTSQPTASFQVGRPETFDGADDEGPENIPGRNRWNKGIQHPALLVYLKSGRCRGFRGSGAPHFNSGRPA